MGELVTSTPVEELLLAALIANHEEGEALTQEEMTEDAEVPSVFQEKWLEAVNAFDAFLENE